MRNLSEKQINLLYLLCLGNSKLTITQMTGRTFDAIKKDIQRIMLRTETTSWIEAALKIGIIKIVDEETLNHMIENYRLANPQRKRRSLKEIKAEQKLIIDSIIESMMEDEKKETQ